MAKRRPSGDGMVRRRADGRWEGRIVVGHKDNGDSIFRYFSGRTQKELMEKLREQKEVYQDADLCEGSNMTLGEWLDRWLDEFMTPAVRSTTLRSYRDYMERYVKPRLGDKQISKITAKDVQKLYRDVQTNGRAKEHPEYGHSLSASTIRSLHGVLHQAMDKAVQERLIAKNPTEEVTIPKKEVRPKKILNDEQLERFMAAIEQDAEWYDFFYTEITTGLRLGEICGLMWEDFDAEKGTLAIRRTVHTETGGELSAGDTKTEQGRRNITLPPSTAELLKRRTRYSKKWIFPNLLRPEKPVTPKKAYARLKKFLREADLPDIRFHDLRHTFATHALTSGVDAKTLSGILGHTKASFTLDTYTHVTGDMQRKAAEIVGDFMNEIAM